MKRFTRTLRFRVAAWYCLALAMGLAVFGVVLLSLAQKHLMMNHDDAMRWRGATAREILVQPVGSRELAEWRATHLARLGKVAVVQKAADVRRLVYESPELITASVMDRISGLPPGDVKSDAFKTFIERGAYWRTYTLSLPSAPGVEETIWILEDLGDVDHTLKRLRLAFLHLIPGGLLVSFLGGFLLSGRALRPVTRIIDMTNRIQARDLSQRLPHPGADDEIGRLVDTLNGMIARLEASFEAMKRFTADASHELRNPLATIRNTIDVALSQPCTAQEQGAALRSIGEEVDRVRSLVEDLLLLARADSGRMVMKMELVRLDDIIEAQLEAHRPRAQEACIQLRSHRLLGDKILGDERWLHQVVGNLLDNAIKYTHQGGDVMVEMEAQGQALAFAVSDCGPGIPAEDLDKVFERFFRSDPTRSRLHVHGLGLGLAIATWVVEAHKGTIRATNRPEGGACFTVTFPLAPGDAQG